MPSRGLADVVFDEDASASDLLSVVAALAAFWAAFFRLSSSLVLRPLLARRPGLRARLVAAAEREYDRGGGRENNEKLGTPVTRRKFVENAVGRWPWDVAVIFQHVAGGALCVPAVIGVGGFDESTASSLACLGVLSEAGFELQDALDWARKWRRGEAPTAKFLLAAAHHSFALLLGVPFVLRYRRLGVLHWMCFDLQAAAAASLAAAEYTKLLDVSDRGQLRQFQVLTGAALFVMAATRGFHWAYLCCGFVRPLYDDGAWGLLLVGAVVALVFTVFNAIYIQSFYARYAKFRSVSAPEQESSNLANGHSRTRKASGVKLQPAKWLKQHSDPGRICRSNEPRKWCLRRILNYAAVSAFITFIASVLYFITRYLLNTAPSLFRVSVALSIAYVLSRFGLMYYHFQFSSLNSLPGPPRGSFLDGNNAPIRNEPFMAAQKRWWDEAGIDAPLLHYTSALGKHNLIVLDADIAGEVLTAPAGVDKPRFSKRLSFLSSVFGRGLITLEGSEWRRHRRIIQPAFRIDNLRSRLDKTVPALAEMLLECWAEAERREIPVEAHLSALTLDVVGDVAFSRPFRALDAVAEWAAADDDDVVDPGAASQSGARDPLVDAIVRLLRPDPVRDVFLALGLSRLHEAINARTRRRLRVLNAGTDDVVRAAREERTRRASSGGNKSTGGRDASGDSLLDLLLVAEEEAESSGTAAAARLSREELREEVKTFIVSGHETTSTLLLWALHVLAANAAVQRRVHEDVVAHAPVGTAIGADRIEKMAYLSAFIREVLRLYPPVGVIVRHTDGKEVLGGRTVPRNARLVVSPHLLHRHPSYWEDPLKFAPERWLERNDAEDETPRHRFAYLPFGAGGRNCVGRHFAVTEAMLVLAPMVRRFRIRPAPSMRGADDFRFTHFVTVKREPELKVCVETRPEWRGTVRSEVQ